MIFYCCGGIDPIFVTHPWKRTLRGWTALRNNVLLQLFLVHFVTVRLQKCLYIYWLSRLWLYHYFEYVYCNIWFFVLVSLAKLHPFNAHIWKSPSPKSLFGGKFWDKYENDTHAHVYHQYDTKCSRISQKRKMYTSSVEDKWCWEVNLSLN